MREKVRGNELPSSIDIRQLIPSPLVDEAPEYLQLTIGRNTAWYELSTKDSYTEVRWQLVFVPARQLNPQNTLHLIPVLAPRVNRDFLAPKMNIYETELEDILSLVFALYEAHGRDYLVACEKIDIYYRNTGDFTAKYIETAKKLYNDLVMEITDFDDYYSTSQYYLVVSADPNAESEYDQKELDRYGGDDQIES